MGSSPIVSTSLHYKPAPQQEGSMLFKPFRRATKPAIRASFVSAGLRNWQAQLAAKGRPVFVGMVSGEQEAALARVGSLSELGNVNFALRILPM